MDVWWNNHFPWKDFEASNWNSQKELVVLEFQVLTLPKTNSSPLKIDHPKIKRKRSSSNHPFSGANLLLVSGIYIHHLVGGFNPSEKYLSNWVISPKIGVKIKNIWVATTQATFKTLLTFHEILLGWSNISQIIQYHQIGISVDIIILYTNPRSPPLDLPKRWMIQPPLLRPSKQRPPLEAPLESPFPIGNPELRRERIFPPLKIVTPKNSVVVCSTFIPKRKWLNILNRSIFNSKVASFFGRIFLGVCVMIFRLGVQQLQNVYFPFWIRKIPLPR